MNRGLTTVAFLPTKFFKVSDAGVPLLDDKLDRLGSLGHMHSTLERIMEPIEEVAINGCLVQLLDGGKVHMHFATVIYSADLPEQKHMLCFKYGNKTN